MNIQIQIQIQVYYANRGTHQTIHTTIAAEARQPAANENAIYCNI